MVILGGQVQILERDTLPSVTITGAVIIVELPKGSSMNDYSEYLTARVGPGSSITGCTFRSIEYWAEQKAEESIAWVRESKVTGAVIFEVKSQQPKNSKWLRRLLRKLGV